MKTHNSLSKKVLTGCFLIFCSCFLFGNNKIEQLKNELKNATDDYERMLVCRKLGNNTKYEDTKQSIHYTQLAIGFANKVGSDQDKVEFRIKLGTLYLINGEFAKSVKNNSELLETPFYIKDTFLIESNNTKAFSYYELGELHLAINYCKKAIQLGQSLHLSELIIPTLGCLAKINMDNNNYDESLAYFQQALKESTSSNLYVQQAYINKDLAELYFYRKEFEKGIEVAQKSISISQKNNLYIIENDARINLSWLYVETNQLDKSLANINEAIKNLTEKKHVPLLVRAKSFKASILSSMGKFDEALDLAKNALRIAEKENLSKELIKTHECIAKLYGKKEDYQNAYFYQSEAEQLRSQLLKGEKGKIIQLAKDKVETGSEDMIAQFEKTSFYGRLINAMGYSIAIALWIALLLILVFRRFGIPYKHILAKPLFYHDKSKEEFEIAQKISLWSFILLVPIMSHFIYWNLMNAIFLIAPVSIMFLAITYFAKKENMKGIFYASLTPYFVCAIAPLLFGGLNSIAIGIIATFIINCFLIPQKFHQIVNVVFACISSILYFYNQSFTTAMPIPFSMEFNLLISLFGISLIVFKIYYYYKNLSDLKRQVFKNNIFFNEISDLNPYFIYTKNKNREFTFVNDALAEKYQLKKSEMLGKKSEEMLDSFEHSQNFITDDLNVINKGIPIIRQQRKITKLNGEEVWLETTKKPIFDKRNNVIGMYGLAHNITDKKKAELHIIESEARYRKLFDYSFDGLLILDVEGNILDCNNNVISFFKYPNKEILLQENINHLIPKYFNLIDLHQFLKDNKSFLPAYNDYITDYENNPLNVEFTLTKLLHNGQPQICCTIKDISEKLILEKKEEEIQKMNNELVAKSISDNQKNKFLNELSDNIKNIIPTIDGQSKQELQQLIRKIGNEIDSDEDFYTFKLKFEKSHPDFFEKILKINPRLTATDLKISAYIKLRLPARDISNILSIEKKSVEMAKYRLKKKLELQKENDLNTFITNL